MYNRVNIVYIYYVKDFKYCCNINKFLLDVDYYSEMIYVYL